MSLGLPPYWILIRTQIPNYPYKARHGTSNNIFTSMNTSDSSEQAAREEWKREDAKVVETLQQINLIQTPRNVTWALFMFVMALFFAWQGYKKGYTIVINGKDVLVVDNLLYLLAAFSYFISGYGFLRTRSNPRDKLLLNLAEDYLNKHNEDSHKLFLNARALRNEDHHKSATLLKSDDRPNVKVPTSTQPSIASPRMPGDISSTIDQHQ